MHGESRRQSLRTLSRTQLMKVGDMICVSDFHDLCPGQVHEFAANLSRTMSQSRRNGIWTLLHRWVAASM